MRFVFGAITSVLVGAASIAFLLGVDVYVHSRLAPYATLNVWGYRGPTVGPKRPLERRIVVVGGSTVLGLGLHWNEAFPALLERALRARWTGTPLSVVNLGFDGENAYAFRTTLADYHALNYDIVILYEGYNNLLMTVSSALRHQSPIFRLTGYYPVLPTALREKAMALRYGGDLGAAYRHEQTVFHPTLATRAGAAALADGAAVADALTRQLGRLTRTSSLPEVEPPRGCAEPWRAYCDAMYRAIVYSRAQRKAVLVVTQPYISDRHVEQQRALRAMLRAEFPADRFVQYIDLGWAVDLHDRRLAYDGMHLTPSGNQRIADAMTGYVLVLLSALSALEAQS
jgi:lysophospholipase L1-like esterase